MIDSIRIEEIRALPVKEAKAAMKEYAKELGVTIKAKTIDNMVSEMGAQLAVMNAPTPVDEGVEFVDPRAKRASALPAFIGPIIGKGFGIYAQLNEIDNVDTCKFQWKKDNVDLVGADEQRLVIRYMSPADSGSYTCTVTEADGTSIESTASIVGVVVIPPKDFPMYTLFKPTWNDFYGAAFTHIGWKALAKAKKILSESVGNKDFIEKLGTDSDTFQIYNLTNMAHRLVLTDARDGYPNVISPQTSESVPIKEIGRWKK